MDDDEATTIVTGRPSSTTQLTDILPDAPAPFEVAFEHVTLDGRPADTAAYRVLDIWTQHSIYRVDGSLTCVEVVDRASGVADPKHAVVGAKLVGGHRRYGKSIHQTRPFPVPGTEAVFATKDPSAPPKLTSRVMRVVMNVRVTTVVLDHDAAFDDVTNALLVPGLGRLFEE
ncbi:MAG TPA: hypothetical protein VM513_10205 [Kofleriaceae bacterium]|jgi:hypothetical protein|nr:hypothetical protein [Kofleriaceae bacterium]